MSTLSRGALEIRKKFPWLNEIEKRRKAEAAEAKRQEKLALIEKGKELGVPDGYMLMPIKVSTMKAVDLVYTGAWGLTPQTWSPVHDDNMHTDWIIARRIPKVVFLEGLRMFDVIDVEFRQINMFDALYAHDVILVLQRHTEVIEKRYSEIPLRNMRW